MPDPDQARALNLQGLELARLERPAEALAAFEAAARAAPDWAVAVHNQGWIRAAMGDVAGAEACYARAAALKADYAEPPAHLAALAMRRGDARTARKQALKALALEANHPVALMALAESALDYGDLRTAADAARGAAMSPRCAQADRGVALSLLGDVFDREDLPAEAWAAWETGAIARRTEARARFEPAGQPTLPGMLIWMIDYFANVPVERWAARPAPPTPSPAAGHVFLIGFPRSGASLVESALAAHPMVVTLGERETLADSAGAFLQGPETLDRLADADPASLVPWRLAYWNRVREAGVAPEGKVFVDRLPLDSIKLPLILRLFPEAKVIFALRDPRDVVFSCFRGRFNLNPATYEMLTLDGAVRLYDLVMRLCALYRDRLGMRVAHVRHEDLAADFEGQSRHLCTVLGLPPSPQGGKTARVAGRVRGSAPRGSAAGGVGAWKPYALWLERILPQLSPWIALYGYPMDQAS